MKQAANHVELLSQFQTNRQQLLDDEWLAALLAPHCRIKRMKWAGSRLRLIQFPVEFARLLVLAAGQQVTSYLEIGTSTGGSFMTADAYLRTAVQNYQVSVGYDRASKLRDFDEYKAVVKSIEFRHQSSKHISLGEERYGLALIDARHLEHWVWHDYQKVKNHARLIAFHDIALEGATVAPAWERIKKDHSRWWEFIDESAPVSARCGIGIVDARSLNG